MLNIVRCLLYTELFLMNAVDSCFLVHPDLKRGGVIEDYGGKWM